MVAVLAPGLGRPAVAHVVAAAQQALHRHGYLLVLISSDSEDGNRFSAHLQQRGIEGVISIDGLIPGQLELPVVLVDVSLAVTSDSVTPNMRGSLVELGESAAENIMQAIGNSGVPRRAHIETKLPAAFFDVQFADLRSTVRAESA